MATSGETSDRMPLWIHQSQSPTLRRMGMVGWSHEVDMKFDGKTFSFNHFFGASKVKVVCLTMISLPLLLIGVPLAVPVSCCSWRDVSTHGLLCLDPCGIMLFMLFPALPVCAYLGITKMASPTRCSHRPVNPWEERDVWWQQSTLQSKAGSPVWIL